MDRGEDMITFKGVSKNYSRGIAALRDVSFNIEAGEFVFIIGASGAGKTTVVKLIMKEENPSSGSVIVNGQDISFVRARRIPKIRRNIGVVFQDFRLLNDRNVYDNVKFALEVQGIFGGRARRKIREVLRLVGLEDRAMSYPRQLSGGEGQRVAMARAMVNEPKILIADEPTGNLDPTTSWEVMDKLVEINKRGTTVITVTHSQEIVNKLKERVIDMDKGRIVSDEEGGIYQLGSGNEEN